ncbi:hypothetical protein [Micromonospora sp. NPDC005806]|uniref:hypothetical protein n=1 Tax=Micromonospora sp. NPDC005806 TaxID=3364234 RepID=UPI0036984824
MTFVELAQRGELSIDVDWWYSLAGVGSTGPAIEHLPGCKRSGSTASWDLPTIADIYVNRVPPDAVATLVQLRRLLGAPWPFSGLRDLLASQPFLAAAGNPSMLYRTLTSLPELRPHLFYGTEGGLMPVWSGT